MTIEEYFQKKKIDIQQFQKEWPEEWLRIQDIFEQSGFKSFDHFMKFRINEWRLRFPLEKSNPPDGISTSL